MTNDKTGIAWTEATWNPVTGCSKVSDGCRHCYAEELSLRRGWSTKPWTHPNAAENVILHPDRLDQPIRWTKPRRIFVNSMSDLFHEQVPDGFIAWVWQIMAECPRHTFQILTKRPERMCDFVTRWNDLTGETDDFKGARGPEETRAAHPSGRGQLFAAYLEELGKTSGGQPPEGAVWPTFDWMEGPRWWTTRPLPNVWLGTSIEDQRVVQRIGSLVATPAAVRFLSCEPLIGPLDLDPWLWEWAGGSAAKVLDWVIVGGESGPNHRPIDPEWVRTLRDQCVAAGVPFWFKQWGGPSAKAGGKDLDGQVWEQMPGTSRGHG